MGNAVVLALLAAVVVLIVGKLIKDKKAGRSSCGHKCGACPMAGQCRKNK